MADSTPFEIRASLLHLAKDVLTQNMYVQIEADKEKKDKDYMSAVPQVTTERIINEAEKLYAFVSKK